MAYFLEAEKERVRIEVIYNTKLLHTQARIKLLIHLTHSDTGRLLNTSQLSFPPIHPSTPSPCTLLLSHVICRPHPASKPRLNLGCSHIWFQVTQISNISLQLLFRNCMDKLMLLSVFLCQAVDVIWPLTPLPAMSRSCRGRQEGWLSR